MGSSERLILAMFALVPSLSIALLTVSGNVALLQGGGNLLFGNAVQDPGLRLYLFESVIVLIFVVTGYLSLFGHRSNVIEAYEEG